MLTKLYLLAIVVAVAVAQGAPRPDDDCEDEYTVFCQTFPSVTCDQTCHDNFIKKCEKIQQHNGGFDNGTVSFEKSWNQFSCMNPGEFSSKMLTYNGHAHKNFLNSATYQSHQPSGAKASAPTSLDYRAGNTLGNPVLVTPIKDQGQCGSCYSFSANAAMEGAFLAKGWTLPGGYSKTYSGTPWQNYTTPTDASTWPGFSEQMILDCSCPNATSECDGCNGGWMGPQMQWVIDQHGIQFESEYPYTAASTLTCKMNPTCASFATPQTSVVYIDGSDPIANENSIQDALLNYGPVSIAIYVTNNFENYNSGIFTDTTCPNDQTNHAILVVGYGSENGQDYWIIKNSWNTWWGEQGYIRYARGTNMCAIGTSAVYPVNS